MYIVQRDYNKESVIEVESNLPEEDLMYKYPNNDLMCVYTHYNPKTGKNEPTENKLREGD